MKNDISHSLKPFSHFIEKDNPFTNIHNSINRALDNFYSTLKTTSTLQDWENFNITPSIDIVDTEENAKIEAEMPGMGPEDIKIDIQDNILTISGQKTTSKNDKGKNYLTREIGYGYYSRSIPLPEFLDTSKAEASFKKGMLWVTIPKKKDKSHVKNEIKIKQV